MQIIMKEKKTSHVLPTQRTITFLRSIAKLLSKGNNSKVAIAILGKAKKICPSDIDIYLDYIKLYEKRRDWSNLNDILLYLAKSKADDMGMQQFVGTWMMKLGFFDTAYPYYLAHLNGRIKENNNYNIANALAKIGICCINLERWEDAEKYLKQAQERIPWDLDACRGTIDLYQHTRNFDQIHVFLERFIHNYPQLYPPYEWMATHIQYFLYKPVESLLWHEKSLQMMENDEIRGYCDRFMTAAELFDPSVDGYIQALIDCGKKEEAIAYIKKMRWTKIGDRGIFTKRLISYYYQIGEFARAETLALRALRTKKQNPDIWIMLASARIKQQRYDAALENIQQALILDKESFDALETLGTIQIKKEMWESAIVTFQNLLKKSPFVSDWLMNLGYCYTKTGQFNKGISIYQKITSFDPMNSWAWVDLGLVYVNLRENDLARSALQKGVKSNRSLDEKRRVLAMKLLEELVS
jgi:tetratricopeptide (TPR) repeat protein